ncbi:hypothetical protein N1495_01395 [Streptococcus didelphis]|uniref:Uncharacterized protein n=1 Tax=Streptococcus didelphis TaxID=102886 RepID=A0ABY9LGE7_9STRE|nr:hypothetical protein [Streptococcus didelphis]WMB27838.1 hypothetical protein N1496_07215 [Streptococcus didelphis]WMB29700.1 hypothetical protein N1495_01395 [Streptococcus didelphis]
MGIASDYIFSEASDYITGKKDIKALKKKLYKMLVTDVYAPQIKSKRRSIASTYDEEITTTATNAKASITSISGQIDTAIKGQFRTKVETVLETNNTKYDAI